MAITYIDVMLYTKDTNGTRGRVQLSLKRALTHSGKDIFKDSFIVSQLVFPRGTAQTMYYSLS